MAKVTSITLENLAGGMTPDIRDESAGVVKLAKHFDILSRPRSLTPYHSHVTSDSSASTHQFTDFAIADVTNGFLFAGGTASGGEIKIFKTPQPFTADTWAAATNGTSSGGRIMIAGVFVIYHDVIYGGTTGGEIWSYDTVGASFTNASTSLSGGVCQAYTNGIVHSKDDIMYIPYQSSGQVPTIAKNNNGSWTIAALTLPSRYRVTCLCEYGNYLAIACRPAVGNGKSVVYLWDRDATLTTLSEVIDFGVGALQIIEQVEGELIGISIRTDNANNLGSRFVFRRYSGSTAIVYKELLASSTTGLRLLYGQKFNANRLYFAGGIEIEGTLHNGIWATGKAENGHWAVWFDRLPNNDTAIAANSLTGFFVYGDFAVISYNDGGYNLVQTSASATGYAATSIIETVINPGITGSILAERLMNKQLQVIAIACESLPSGGQLVVKWKVDGGNWNTAHTETTAGRVVTEIPNAEASYTAGREYQFRIESSGGVVVTGFFYKYEVLSSLI